MDAETALVLFLAGLSLIAAAQTLWLRSSAPGARLWVTVNAIVVAVALLALWLLPAWALAITVAVVVPFVLLPGILARMARRRFEAEDLRGALWCARLGALLHPTETTQEACLIYQAAAEVQRTGSSASYRRLMDAGQPRVAAWARLAQEIFDGEWTTILARHDRGELTPLTMPALRALARLGRTHELVALARRTEPTLDASERDAVRLTVLTETGRVAGVQAMLDGPMAHFHADARALTLARARLVADPSDTNARGELVRLAREATPIRVRRSAASLADESVSVVKLDPADKAWVEHCEQRVASDALLSPLSLRRAWLTQVLVLAIAAMFAIQLWTGAIDDVRPLLRLGALWTPYVHTGGEWWRLGAAMFLHGGWLHVAMNLLVLTEIGRQVERLLPRWAIALVYVGAGVGGFAIITWLAAAEVIDEALVVGASGAIFGLIGAWGVVLAVLYRRHATPLFARRLGFICILVGAQVIFDLLVPQSSMLGHLSGFAIGVALGAVLVPWVLRPQVGSPFFACPTSD